MIQMKSPPLRLLPRMLLLVTALGAGTTVHAAGAHDGGHDPSGEGRHVHSKWVAAPPEYASLQGGFIWYDDEAAARGSTLYAQHCQMCHGLAGKGDGVVAASLDHKPSDLTQHRHTANGQADGYLFWRISEGGTVSPFAEQDSRMPAFGQSLTEAQRWDTLAFVHQQFHGGFAPIGDSGSMGMEMKGMPKMDMAPMGGDDTGTMPQD